MPGAELLAHLVPEVGVDGRAVLHLLRRAGDVDRRGQELPVAVPEEQHLDAVVLVAFDVAEVRPVRAAVHLRVPVGVDGATVLGHDGVPQAPADPARRPGLPGLHRRLGHAVDQERDVFGRLHDPVGGELIVPFLHHRRGVGVRGAEDELVDVEVGDPVLEAPADLAR